MMSTSKLVFYMAPTASTRREEGMHDARVGRPECSRDADYRRGYELGLRLPKY
jgi:hypothetical protein